MATATRTKGFVHTCPKCGEADTLKLHLDDVAVMTCGSCDNEISADDIREVIAGWTAMLRWVDTAPVRNDD